MSDVRPQLGLGSFIRYFKGPDLSDENLNIALRTHPLKIDWHKVGA